MADILAAWGEMTAPGDGRLGIILPSRDRRVHLRICLKHLQAQSDRNWDLVVVEDGNEAAAIMEEFGPRLAADGHGVLMVRGPADGPAAASQAGFLALVRPLALRLDDDLRPEPDFLAKLRALLASDASIAAAAGHYPNPDAIRAYGLPDENGRRLLETYGGRIIVTDKGYEPIQRQTMPARDGGDPPYEVDHIYSAYMARRDVLERAGGFASEYHGPGIREETDLTLRMRMLGFRLVVDPSAVAWHHHGASGGTRSYDPETRRRFEIENVARFNAKMDRWWAEGKLPFLVDLRSGKG